jgi:hypothetical protein
MAMLARFPFTPSSLGTHSALARSLRQLTPSVDRSANAGPAANRRGEIRRLTRVACRVRRADSWRLVGDRTLDMSPQGMLLVSDEELDTSVDLVVSFQATELPIWFDTMATMTRVVAGRRPGDSGRRALGLHFETLPAVQRLILRGHLSKLPATYATREPPLHIALPARKQAREEQRDYARIVKDIWEGR